MTDLSARPPRIALLWTLAAVVIVADQLSKAWMVYRLGALHGYKSFSVFLPHYLGEFQRGQDGTLIYGHYSIIYGRYHDLLRAQDQVVWDPWLRWHLTTNTGAAWSMFTGNSFLLSFVSLAIAGLLLWVWNRNFRVNLGMTIAIGAIIGGALGNSLDRFRLREVVDFVAVKIPYIGQLFPKLGNPYDFPIFNVADASAVCGTLALAGYLLWLDLTAGKRKRGLHPDYSGGLQPFPSGIELNEQTRENLRNLDTSSLPRWQQPEDTEADSGEGPSPASQPSGVEAENDADFTAAASSHRDGLDGGKLSPPPGPSDPWARGADVSADETDDDPAVESWEPSATINPDGTRREG